MKAKKFLTVVITLLVLALGAGAVYYFYFYNGSNTDEVTNLTISNGATFEDGATTFNLEVGDELPDFTLTGSYASEGQALKGWIVDDGVDEYYVSNGDFTMPDSDNVTITPYVTSWYNFNEDEGTAVAGESGILDLSDVENEFNSSAFATQTANMFNNFGMTGLKRSCYSFINGQVGTEYVFSGEEGSQFRNATLFGAKNANNTTIKYSIINTGDVDVDLTISQINSSNTTTNMDSEDVVLASGESTEVSLSINVSNANLMFLIETNSDVDNANIFMTAEVDVIDISTIED